MNNNNTYYTPDPADAIADNNGGRTKGNFGYSLGLCVGIIILFIIITYVSYMRRFRSNPNSHNTTHATAPSIAAVDRTNGLDESTISSFPELEYSQLKIESRGLFFGCSICLTDYKESDGVRLLPDCEHFFHVDCVDRWLSMHPTCPICRNYLVGRNVHR